MPDNLNKFSQFWKELKRRNVHRLLAIYAGTAYVILEASTIIFPRWGLPDWTIDLVLYLLILGAIITFVISWIYDITPEGVKKTKPLSEIQEGEVSTTPNGWKIASYISAVVIVVLIVLNIIPRINNNEVLDKSIAVLPFASLSDNPEKQYLADGVMDAILLHLSKIEDLRVMSRTSVEQYRKSDKTITNICEELNVAFVLEGSFQKYGDKARLIVQLIQPGIEGHLWANEYDRNFNDIFSVQSEVAQIIAGELKAIITPKEKELIEKVPTTNLTAYDFYQRAREEHLYYQVSYQTRQLLPNVEYLYHQALEHDKAFAEAYIGLAQVYWDKHYSDTYFTEEFMDSVLYLADVALSINDGLADAYAIRGEYYREKGLYDKALKEYNKAIDLNPSNWLAYFSKAQMYIYVDHIEVIDNLQKAASVNRGQELPLILAWIAHGYAFEGFSEKGEFYAQEALKMLNDSSLYNWMLGLIQQTKGNWDKATDYFEIAYGQASNPRYIYLLTSLGGNHSFVGNDEEALKIFREALDVLITSGGVSVDGMHRIGYAFWQNGFKDEANYYLDQQIEYCNMANDLGRQYSKNFYSYYDLAGIYALRGDKERAFENLRKYNQKQKITSWMAEAIKIDPFFDTIRDEPEFQKILNEVEAKYQAEYERVRKWLEENEML